MIECITTDTESAQVKIGVGVNGSGEFSLLGITKASAELKATFEITFVPKQEKQ